MIEIPHTDQLVTAPPRGRRKLAGLTLIFAVAGIAFGLAIGFVEFADRVAGGARPANPHAEGIVVLTGGSDRIDEALLLLAEGRAGRLLISGVNPAVTRETLAATVAPGLHSVLECCVDLDHRAQDTAGNAVEARDWAERQGFSSLIVVTSGYHMQRSMAELAEAMPDKLLIPFPVNNPDLHLASWWSDRETVTLLMREYGKFLFAEARRMLSPARPANLAVGKG
jgi:uncharacterized SAM-binding protein YcdF (DUF218 family)